MARFHHRARRVRHNIFHHTNESKAKMVASRSYEKDTPEWEAAFEAKLREFNINAPLTLVKAAQFSNSLNKNINLKDFNFS